METGNNQMSEYTISVLMAIGTCVGSVATLIAVAVAIYNARVAINIATREKRHEVRVYCTSGLLTISPDGNVQNYIRTQSSSPTYKCIKESQNTIPILEIRVDNIGELPVRIESISIDTHDQSLPLNAVNTYEKAELIIKTIDVGMTAVTWYEFEEILRCGRKEFLREILDNNVEISLSIQTNFWKIFSSKLPNDFIHYITK